MKRKVLKIIGTVMVILCILFVILLILVFFSSGGSGFLDLTNVVMYFLAAFSVLSAVAAFIIFKILKNN